ncbi:PAS domain-containing protein [Paracoccus sp. R86501]|uniref:PAS domain-containing protein n=1 Tax=Paracoccus sp. R86501 TaxID=3101711 RepID=UPI0036725EEF
MPAAQIPDTLRAQFTKSHIALSLATAQKDMPLCLVNEGFTTLSGYGQDQVQGRNCRFLQTPETPAEQVSSIRDFLRDDHADDGRFPVLNRTRDGRDFMNLVFLSKLRRATGELAFVLASQFDLDKAQRRGQQVEHDASLARNVNDVRRAAGQLGLIMADSAELIARSITTLARITIRDE